MRSISIWFLCATLAVAQIAPQSVITLQTKLPSHLIGNRFILEFASASSLPNRDLEKRTVHELVYASLHERSVSFQVDKEYNASGLFIGAAITLKNADDAKAVASTPGIIAVRPVKALKLAQPVDVQVVNDETIAKSQIDTESTHVMTGVDKAHATGITGKGVKIGIIDVGIDYTHPLLGGGFGPGHKVVGGYDFVGDAYNGSNTPVPGPDPFVQCSGHGTHVAGIIGANPGNKYNISGVAYDAQLYAYRVFGCSGYTTDDVVLEALLRGVKDGNDILTMSLGAANDWTESAGAVVASRITTTGIFVTTAGGNDGASGAWYPSSPGTGLNVIAVASVENTILPVQYALVFGIQYGPIMYYSLFPLPIVGTLPIYATSKNTSITDDACSPLPASTPDLSKYLVIVRRGTCAFVTKLANIGAKGGKVALIYDNGNGAGYISAGNYSAALIQAKDGEFLVKQFIAGTHVTLSFPQMDGAIIPDPISGLISSFSSYGPTIDLLFKPVIAAPGGNILSTLPIPLGSFGIASGTSMSTPFVAGSIALLLQAKGKGIYSPLLARTLFETTAKSVPSAKNNTAVQQTLSQQGAGLIQVYDAINYRTTVVPGELILNDTAHFQGSHQFAVTNFGSSAQTYKLYHVPAGTAMTVGRFETWPNLGPVPLSDQYATVTFSKQDFTLAQHETANIEVQITPPYGIDAKQFPVYSGFIQIDSNAGESLHVSYLGVAASLIDKHILDTSSHFFGFELPALLDSNSKVQTEPKNYTLADGDTPTLVYRLLFGTPVLKVDLVKSDVHITSTLNARSNSPGVYSFPQEPHDPVTSVPTVGNIFEFDYVARNNEDALGGGFNTFTLTSAFANGTTIPNGSYRLLLRALRVTADMSDPSKYEAWLSPIVNVSA